MPFLHAVPPLPDDPRQPDGPAATPPPGAAVVRRDVLPAEPAEVWDALVDAERLADWWGEGTELEPVAGGAGRFVDSDGTVREAMVVEASPGRRLRIDWWPAGDDDAPASRVTIDLEPGPGGTTVVTVTEAILADLVVHPALFLPGRPDDGRSHHGPRCAAASRSGVGVLVATG